MEELLVARSYVYGFLARLFLGDWDSLALGEMTGSIKGEGEETEIAALVGRLAGADSYKLKVEYDNLFLVPGRHYVPPLETYYKPEGMLVAQVYEHTGFALPQQLEKSSDHLGCELAFMQAAILAEQRTQRTGDRQGAGFWAEVQRDFLQLHLAGFTDHVWSGVKEKEVGDFYCGVLEYARKFLQEDLATLAV